MTNIVWLTRHFPIRKSSLSEIESTLSRVWFVSMESSINSSSILETLCSCFNDFCRFLYSINDIFFFAAGIVVLFGELFKTRFNSSFSGDVANRLCGDIDISSVSNRMFILHLCRDIRCFICDETVCTSSSRNEILQRARACTLQHGWLWRTNDYLKNVSPFQNVLPTFAWNLNWYLFSTRVSIITESQNNPPKYIRKIPMDPPPFISFTIGPFTTGPDPHHSISLTTVNKRSEECDRLIREKGIKNHNSKSK